MPKTGLRTTDVQKRPGGTAPRNLPQRLRDTGTVAPSFLAFQTLFEGDGDGPGERLTRELRQLNGQPMGFGVLDVETHSSPLWENFIVFLPLYILNLVWSKHSCGLALIIFQQSPEPFATLHGTLTRSILPDRRKEQDIPLPLMIPLVMIMLHILLERMLRRRFTTKDEQ